MLKRIAIGTFLGLGALVWWASTSATVPVPYEATTAGLLRSEISVKPECRRGGFNNVMLWTVTVTNKGKAAWGDLAYRTSYAGETDTVMHRGKGVIPIRVDPGKTRKFEVNDGLVPQGLDRCGFEITDGARITPTTAPKKATKK